MQINADVIWMGTRGRTLEARASESTASRVIQLAPCPGAGGAPDGGVSSTRLRGRRPIPAAMASCLGPANSMGIPGISPRRSAQELSHSWAKVDLVIEVL